MTTQHSAHFAQNAAAPNRITDHAELVHRRNTAILQALAIELRAIDLDIHIVLANDNFIEPAHSIIINGNSSLNICFKSNNTKGSFSLGSNEQYTNDATELMSGLCNFLKRVFIDKEDAINKVFTDFLRFFVNADSPNVHEKTIETLEAGIPALELLQQYSAMPQKSQIIFSKALQKKEAALFIQKLLEEHPKTSPGSTEPG